MNNEKEDTSSKTRVQHKKQKKKKRKHIFCMNCGKQGHKYKYCRQPIISAGIILYRRRAFTNKIEFLHICRKDTIGYVDFVRGKYRLGDILYIQKLLNMMTNEEKKKIQQLSFTQLWRDIWCITDNNLKVSKHKFEFDKSAKRLQILKQGYILKHQQTFVSLSLLLSQSPDIYTSPEWGFPKGRRSIGETDVECALREFTEETGIPPKDHSILPSRPIVSVFMGQNNRKYKHIFFVSKYNGNKKCPAIDQNNIIQKSEIGAIDWFTLREACARFREYNQLKVRSLKIASKIIPHYSK